MTAPAPGAGDAALSAQAEATLGAYLDRVVLALAGRPFEIRAALAEIEDHLRESVAAGRARGLDDAQAALAAVRAMGPPRAVTAGPGLAGGVPTRARALLGAVGVLTVVGLLSIGVSGMLAEAVYRAWGPLALAGDPTGVTYTAARCADYAALAPGQATCALAAAVHHSGEVIEPRIGAGVLGLVGLAVLGWRRRGRVRRYDPAAGFVIDAAGAAAFGVVGSALLLDGLAVLVQGPRNGAGAPLTAGVVAATVCLVFLARLARRWGALGGASSAGA